MISHDRFPDRVIIGECWARDGLQNEREVVPTAAKIELISRMVEAGIPRIEATSFAHPRYLPQFADAEKVLKEIPRVPGTRYRAICTNERAILRAIASKEAGYGVDEIAMVLSSTDAHNQANVNMPQADAQRMLERMTRLSLDTGHDVLGWVLTSFGCPIQGDVELDQVSGLGRWWKDIGATIIGFGDTTGAANPRQVDIFYGHVLDQGFTKDEVVVHFHDTRGWGIANSLVALSHGLRHIDCSLGAIGGQPATSAANYHRGHTGNTCTEDLVGMFHEMGVETGIDIDRLLAAGARAEEVLGRRLRSNFLLAGPVPHRGVIWDREKGLQGTRPVST